MGVDRHLLDYAQVTASDKVMMISLAQAKLLRVDNTGQSPYPRWRLEATPSGQLIAINNPPMVNGKHPATIALIQPQNTPPNPDKRLVASKMVFLIFYKSDDENLFKQKIDHELVVKEKKYPLKQQEDWQRKPNSYQASFTSSNEALEALNEVAIESTANIQSAVTNICFGVGGFKNVYSALAEASTHPSTK
jgi:hypothetical protein